MADSKDIIRCSWCEVNDLMRAYHDEEWGVPVHDDLKHFEFIVLDSFQAGLSWATILNKRENFRKAFASFNPEKVALFDQSDFDRLMNDAGIIRNKAKINATVNNARQFLRLQRKHGSFDEFIWQFTDGKTIRNKRVPGGTIPARSAESDEMSKKLIQEGFKFAGSTICYAYMQAAGMVNDHFVSCFRYQQV